MALDKLFSTTPMFVDVIPRALKHGTLYICHEYQTAIHLCCCGCGSEVVTPLGSNGWQLQKVGETVSLFPSIGNRFKCQSHYWIKNNNVKWL